MRIALLLAALAAVPPLATAAPGTWTVMTGSASAAPGDSVDVPILLQTDGVSISAIAFTVEWDADKLLLAGDPAAGSKVDLPAPAHFTSSSWVSSAGSSVGVTVYDRQRPIESLADGPLAILRFQVRPQAQGFARVAVRTGSLSASAPQGTLVNGAGIIPGGVSISSARPSLHLVPLDIHFGSVGIGSSEKRTAVAVNAGSGVLTLLEVRLEGSPAFSVSGTALPRQIAAGSSIPLELVFTPGNRGETSARLVAVSAEAGTATIQLRGAGSEGELYHDRRLVVPAVASLAGGDGSRWFSTLSFYNSGTTPAGARLRLVRAGLPGLEREVELIIQAGESIGWSDVLGELFDEDGVSGALRIDATTDALIVRSSTYNQMSGGGRIAQSVPVIAWTELFHTGEEAK
ncbi:MAG: cohesin domain-containing protein, partial [Thermoanaerobaculia bacterium]